MLSTNPTNTFSNWKCTACGNIMKVKEIEEIIETLENEVSLLPMEVDIHEEKLKAYKKLLHPNHHIMIDLKFNLVQVSCGYYVLTKDTKYKVNLHPDI